MFAHHFPSSLLFLFVESCALSLLLHSVQNLPCYQYGKTSEQHTWHNDGNDSPRRKRLNALFSGLVLDQLIIHDTVRKDESAVVRSIDKLTLLIHVIRADLLRFGQYHLTIALSSTLVRIRQLAGAECLALNAVAVFLAWQRTCWTVLALETKITWVGIANAFATYTFSIAITNKLLGKNSRSVKIVVTYGSYSIGKRKKNTFRLCYCFFFDCLLTETLFLYW